MKKKISKSKSMILTILGFAIMLALWSFLSIKLGNTRLPTPWGVVKKFFTTILSCPEIKFQGAGKYGYLPHVATTLMRYLVGVLSGTALSIIALFGIARFHTFRDIFSPVVNILRSIPPLALAPFFLLWFGISQTSIIAIITFYAFTMIFVAGAESIERMDPVQSNFARTLGANENTVVSKVVMPSILPDLAGPLKVSYSWSWGLVIVGELLGAKTGIGRIINAFISTLKTDLIVVAIIWIVILAIIFEKIVSIILNRMLEWNKEE